MTTTTPSLPQAVLTDAESMIATLKSQVRIGRARWHSNKQQSNVIEVTFADADAIIAALSRMGGESVPAETWIVVKEHVWEHGDGGRPTLAYLLPSEFGRQTFPSFDAASAWIKDGQWPLGFAAMKLDAPTAPAQQAAPTVTCEECNGAGEVGEPYGGSEFQPPGRDRCESCGGSGRWPAREAEMVTLRKDEAGTPTVWCDPEVADLVSALNAGDLATLASCSGHGHRPGFIAMKDGRWLMVFQSKEDHDKAQAVFPLDINGQQAAGVQGEPYAVKVHSWGGSSGVHDYLMSDGSIKAMRPDEVKPHPAAAQSVPKGEATQALADKDAVIRAITEASGFVANAMPDEDIIDYVRRLAASAPTVGGVLFEHEDGRYAVDPDTTGDPKWHRLGPVSLPMQAVTGGESCPHGDEHIVHDCLRCGAPVCCGKCCARDAYEGAREDLLDWKRRALKAEDLVCKFTREVNGPTFMGEPAAPSAPAVGDAPAVVPAGDAVKQAEQLVKDFKEAANSKPNASNGYNLKIWDALRDKLAAALATTAPAQHAAQEASSAAEPVALPNVHKTAPKTIYLVIGEDTPPEEDFSRLERSIDTITWCEDQIDENSIPYVRADLATPPTPPSAPHKEWSLRMARLEVETGASMEAGGPRSTPTPPSAPAGAGEGEQVTEGDAAAWAIAACTLLREAGYSGDMKAMTALRDVIARAASAPPSHEGEDARDASARFVKVGGVISPDRKIVAHPAGGFEREGFAHWMVHWDELYVRAARAGGSQ